MNTEQQPTPPQTPPDPPPPGQEPPPQPAWGAPPPPPEQRSKWSVRRTVIAVAIAVGIAAAGGVAIYAASGSVDNEGGPSGGAPNGGRMVVGGPMGDLGHGEFQNGEVKDISDTSITVESEDGYEETYTIGDDTQQSDDIATGDEVMVVATTDGDTATAVTIMEAGAMPQRGNGPNGGPPQMKDNQNDGNQGGGN